MQLRRCAEETGELRVELRDNRRQVLVYFQWLRRCAEAIAFAEHRLSRLPSARSNHTAKEF